MDQTCRRLVLLVGIILAAAISGQVAQVQADCDSSGNAGDGSCPFTASPVRYWMDERRFKAGETPLVREALEDLGAVLGGESLKVAKGSGPQSTLGHGRMDDWDVYWSPTRTCLEAAGKLRKGQKICCIPGLRHITKKSELLRTLKHYLGPEGAFSIVPRTHSLDVQEEVDEWKAHMEEQEANGTSGTWVLKKNSHLAKGLKVLTSSEALAGLRARESGEVEAASAILGEQHGKTRFLLAQQYIPDPLLIDGRKFGVRIWVLVTSLTPIRAYLSSLGLALFSTEEYAAVDGEDEDDWRKRRLTNAAVNDEGEVWTLDVLRNYMRGPDGEGEGRWEAFWSEARRIVSLTLGAVAPEIRLDAEEVGLVSGGFQLMGFDLLIDASWRPWLLEANGTPSMSTKGGVMSTEKGKMLRDLFKLIGVRAPPLDGPGAGCAHCEDEEGDGVAVCEARCARAAGARALVPVIAGGGGQGEEGGIASMACTEAEVAERALQGGDFGFCMVCITPEDVEVVAEAEEELARSRTFEGLGMEMGQAGAPEDALLAAWHKAVQRAGGKAAGREAVPELLADIMCGM